MRYWILVVVLLFGCRSGSDSESQVNAVGAEGINDDAGTLGDDAAGGDAVADGDLGFAGGGDAGGTVSPGVEDGAVGAMGPCANLVEGAILSEGTFEECIYSDQCVQIGTEKRVDIVCSAGVPTEVEVQQPCMRVTDGNVLMEGVFGECTYTDDCVETGVKSRLDRVCQDGLITDKRVTTDADCERDTDETVVLRGDYGECGYANECSQMGARRRTDRICESGVEIDKVWSLADGCNRETDGTLINVGEFSACSYADECAETGFKQRTDQVCSDGGITAVVVTSAEGCAQVPDASCGPVTCDSDNDCGDDERCLCAGYWFDRDGEFSCSDFGVTPRVCLPCAGLDGPVCVYDGQPEFGTTYDSLCDAANWPPYVIVGECPAQCAGRIDCPGSCDLCIQGRCESQLDDDGACDLF